MVLAAAILFAAGVLAAATSEPARMDFVAQYAAARLVLDGRGASVLDPGAVITAERAAAPARLALLPFVQVPAVPVLLMPLALLPFEAAFLVAATIDALLVVSSLALLRPSGGDRWGSVLLAVAPPAVVAVAHAQTTPLVLLLVAVAARAGPRAGGVALGLTLLRPQTAPLLLLAGALDPARRWWAAAGATAVVALSAAVVGIDGLGRYVAALADASAWSVTGEEGLAMSIGWAGIALRAGAGWIGVALSVVSLAAGAVIVARARPADRTATASLWSLLGSPHVLIHDAVLAYPAAIELSRRRRVWVDGSVVAWMLHVVVAPVGVIWSVALAAARR